MRDLFNVEWDSLSKINCDMLKCASLTGQHKPVKQIFPYQVLLCASEPVENQSLAAKEVVLYKCRWQRES